MADYVDQWSAAGMKNIFGDHGQGRRDAVRGRRRRRGARLAGRRRPDHHLHRLPGPAADDPQHVQDRGRAAARRVPRERAHRGHPALSTSSATTPTSWPAARPASRMLAESNVAGGHGPVRRGAPGRHQGRASPSSTSSTASAPPTRSRRSPCGTTTIWPSSCDMDAVARLPRARAEPRAPRHARQPRERRHLLPAPRGVQQPLRRAARGRRGVHAQGSTRSWAPTTSCSTTTARRTPTASIVAMGSFCDVARGGHRLPQRARREGRPGQGAPVPSVRLREVRRRAARDGRRRSPSWTAPRSPAPSASPCTWTSSTRSCRRASRASRWSAAATAWAPRTPRPASAFAIYKELEKDEPRREFTVGIVDDVTQPVASRGSQLPQHRRRGHHRVQVLGPGRRRHRRREQELHQDHRRPHRQVRAGVLPVRLQEDRRRDHQPPALRRQAHHAAPTTSTRPTSWPATTPAT